MNNARTGRLENKQTGLYACLLIYDTTIKEQLWNLNEFYLAHILNGVAVTILVY